MYSEETDGVDHINVYSKGKTELGRWLSNFSASSFQHELGYFKSMEGFWYYVSTGMKHECLKNAVGFKAKELGKTFDKVNFAEDAFEAMICSGIRAKLLANRQMLNKLINTDPKLPFVHYYSYGGKAVPAGYEWMMDYLNNVRATCRRFQWYGL